MTLTMNQLDEMISGRGIDNIADALSIGTLLPAELSDPKHSDILDFLHRSLRRAKLELEYDQRHKNLRVVGPKIMRPLPALPAIDDDQI